MHSCRPSCFKYCQHITDPTLKKCRYDKPEVENPENLCKPCIIPKRDRFNRMQLKVKPGRNNANINGHARSPLFLCGLRGNHDLQYLDNKYGGIEYASKYCSKSDQADFKTLKNIYARNVAKYIQKLPDGEDITFKNKLFFLANAFILGEEIGAVYATYVVARLPLVKTTRTIININADKIISKSIITNKEILQTLNADDDAYIISPTSNLGKCLAFENLVRHQLTTYNDILIDFYSFLTHYDPKCATTKQINEHKKNSKFAIIPKLFLSKQGQMLCSNSDSNSNKSKTKLESFMIENIYYCARRKPAVLAICPYRAVDEEIEENAYAMLVLHAILDMGGFNTLLGNCQTAVERLREVKCKFAEYVLPSLNKRKTSDSLLSNTGSVDNTKIVNPLEADDDDGSQADEINQEEFLLDHYNILLIKI